MASSTVYATKEELKSQPGMLSADKDDVLDLLLSAASRAVDGFCNRQKDGFVAAATATDRDFIHTSDDYTRIDEALEVEAVATRSAAADDYVLWDVDDWIAFAGSFSFPTFNEIPYTGILAVGDSSFGINSSAYVLTRRFANLVKFPTVRVTAKWGYALEVPPAVKQATITLASRWFKRGESFWSDAAASPDMGQIMYRQVVDPDVKMMLTESRLVRVLYAG